jgi:hypothetical protein
MSKTYLKSDHFSGGGSIAYSHGVRKLLPCWITDLIEEAQHWSQIGTGLTGEKGRRRLTILIADSVLFDQPRLTIAAAAMAIAVWLASSSIGLFPAAFTSRSTSRSVRYSRVRYWGFGSRPGGTVLFTVLGALARDLDFTDNFPCAHD